MTREISPEQSQVFQFSLQQDHVVDVTLSAKDFHLFVRVIAPDGSTVMEVVQRHYGPLTWEFIAPLSGRYQLSVSSFERANSKTQYELKIGQIRPATARDRASVAPLVDFYRAEILRSRSESPEVGNILNGYESAAVAWTRIGEWSRAAVAWEQLAEVHFNRGDYKSALQGFLKAQLASRRSRDSFLVLTQRLNIGYVYVYLGELNAASDIFDECERMLEELPADHGVARKRVEAQLQNNQGEVKYLRGQLKATFDPFRRALALRKDAGDRRGEAVARLNLGYSYLDSGSATEATQEFETALKLTREMADKRGEALSLTAQGNLYTLLGDRYTAAASHRHARDLFRLVGDEQGEAITLNGLGKVFEDLNRKHEALDNYSQALRLNNKIGNKDFAAVSAYYVGRVWRDLGDFDQALEHLRNSIVLNEKLGKRRMSALASMDIASILVKQHKFAEAERTYRKTLDFYKDIADLRRQALTYQGLGELHNVRGQPAMALSQYELSLNLFQQIKDPQGQAESLYWLASLSQQQGRLNEARAYSSRAVELIEFQRARLVGQNWRSSYFASVRRHFELYVDILMQLDREQPGQGFAVKAFEASEQSRARSLLETLAESQSEIRLGVDQALLNRERQLRQQLSAKAVYQLEVLNTVDQNTDPELEGEIRELNNEYDFVQTQIKAQSPAFAQLIKPSTLTLQQVQASLKEEPEKTVLLEYMLGVDRSYVWLVTATELIARELPGRRVLENLSYEVYQSLTARRKQPDERPAEYHERYPVAEERFCPSASQLSQILLAPLAGASDVERLLVAADGNLQYLAFDALPAPAADGSLPRCRLNADAKIYEPLLEKLQVVNLPSFSSLTILRQLKMPAPARGIAVWADPVFELDDPRVSPELADSLRARVQREQTAPVRLPANESATGAAYLPPTRLLSTEEEAQSIMRFAPAGLTVLLTGFAANRESTIDRDWNNYRILHFATHSFVNTRYPSLSGLLLSTINEQGQTQNGLLQLHDIYGLRLNADLVVLSGCQTGLGEELSGEGLVGLTQGFLYAGSRSVMVSLWPVEDKTTASLMADFYRAMLEENLAPAVALRQAKLRMLRN
ncbi:MAG TPA: CHAT domain-containing protein, partial [Pyrinomonadaceae bacterium]|nr:CHAT domain-containing protein [Pyrinomonadaceae bacterium]